MVKITIVTVVFNGELHLEETIASVINQNYENLEYIIVDGGSTDNTLGIIQKYRDKIDLVVSEPDRGISDAFNKGIRLATGDIIGLISSDDFLLEGALNELRKAYEELPLADVFYGSHISLDPKTMIYKRVLPKKNLSSMPYSLAIGHPPTFVAKKCYEQHGLFDENYKCAMDFELLLRFYLGKAVFKRIFSDLVVVRMGGTNQIHRAITLMEMKNISLNYGGNVFLVYLEFFKKKVKDIIKRAIASSPFLQDKAVYFGRTKKISNLHKETC
jgi:glycosyltransferase involved in cell wall biosynthesis